MAPLQIWNVGTKEGTNYDYKAAHEKGNEEKEERPGGAREGLRGRVHNSTCSRTVERKREKMERVNRGIVRLKEPEGKGRNRDSKIETTERGGGVEQEGKEDAEPRCPGEERRKKAKERERKKGRRGGEMMERYQLIQQQEVD
ncbi:uncharacterized protein BO96DRAFT_430607 [Aspergillus niger CBS 101883]|uniref:Uncharacterized protein n=2 Tax=Aspergillus niger TaxID=5061 RepID=A2QPJ4_ASPNC|nr:uncharacterized protein BO96DRAFT_430607 [Aspergillus niger CBS 101883]XP_059601101.1 hypothetical protein An07g09660 [Aspergillus niger]PYH60684.1 hypothetical protein BO96DRAFT_430607 [Aspergillus niger CBS 101883]CAK39731.1 hypothetical protein An07g09660 [Aspergillus niger]